MQLSYVAVSVTTEKLGNFILSTPSVVTLGFQLFQGNVFILSLPNLVWMFIGLIACMGLLLVKIAL